jgi:hypothetical protein
MRHVGKLLWPTLAVLVFLPPLAGDEPRPRQAARPSTKVAWTLDEALEQLQFYPRDAYLQYVAMQLARREGRHQEIGKKLAADLFGGREGLHVDLFNLFAGTLAVQESLQLKVMHDPDAEPAGQPGGGGGPAPMPVGWVAPPPLAVEKPSPLPPGIPAALAVAALSAGTAPPGLPAAMPWPSLVLGSEGDGGRFLLKVIELHRSRQERLARNTLVSVAGLHGPQVKSHPWKKMLAGKKPEVSFLSRCVPDDFFLAEFRSLNKLLDFLETSEQWGAYLYQQGNQDARTRLFRERLQTQLAVPSSDLLRPFYDQVVEEVAVAGSDLLLTEGTDITLLFRFQQPALFKRHMESFLADTTKARPDARRSHGELLGVAYEHLASADRSVCLYAAYPAPGLHVRSNSLAALRRVLAAIKGKDAGGKAVRRLGDTAEFRYIRTLLPRGAKEEDGLIYLSDPFIRNLVGPRLRLTERRRLLSYNHLCMIGHAAQLFRTEHGKAAGSLAELVQAGCCPAAFNQGELRCPFGGRYSLAADGLTGVCSHCGTTQFLTPCCEMHLEKVSKLEADAYAQFVKDYSEFWHGFFDPIALRIQVTPKRYRLETLILPLIDNSIYSGLALALGGQPEPLDALPVPRRNLFSMALRFNKEALLQALKTSIFTELGELDKSVARGAGALFSWPLQGVLPGNLPWAVFAPPDEAVLNVFDPEKKEQLQLLAAASRAQLLLAKGLGNQVGIHVYDVPLTFDAGLEGVFGEALAQAAGRGGAPGIADLGSVLPALVLAPWFFAPTYMSLPVKDAQVVDRALADFDRLLAPLARKRFEPGVPVTMDYYKITTRGALRARCAGLRIGPFRVRAYWARLGDGLYVANQPSVLDDLQAAGRLRARAKTLDQGPTAHALVRLRPRHWDQALEGFRLTWAENSRDACINNLGPLSSAARAFTAAGPANRKADRSAPALAYAERMYGLHFCCPEGGHYVLSPDGKTMTCSVHGSAADPRQREEPARDTPLDRLMRSFADLTAALTFREDGLHAVLVIERK